MVFKADIKCRPCSASAADVAGEGDQPFIRGPYSGSKDRGPAGGGRREREREEALASIMVRKNLECETTTIFIGLF